MRILGVNVGNKESSLALIDNGVIVAAMCEERLSRQRYDERPPLVALERALRSRNWTLDDMWRVADRIYSLIKLHYIREFPEATRKGDYPPAVWFDLDGGGRVQLRQMPSDVLTAINKQTDRKVIDYKRLDGKAERFEAVERDEDSRSLLFWDYVRVGWENLLDKRAEEIPCTKENKLLLMQRSTVFAEFIGKSLAQLAADELKQEEEEEKN